jgi:hypothetical protein
MALTALQAGLLATGGSVGMGTAGALLTKSLSKKRSLQLTREQFNDTIKRRALEIDAFRNDLRTNRESFAGKLRLLQNRVFNRFASQTESQFAGRGLSISGGSFASALGKRGTDIQFQEDVNQFDRERQDLTAVQGLRENLFRASQAGLFNQVAHASDVDAFNTNIDNAFARSIGNSFVGGARAGQQQFNQNRLFDLLAQNPNPSFGPQRTVVGPGTQRSHQSHNPTTLF